jgi:hypothetical protein
MQITFRGHVPTERSVTVDAADLATLNDLLRAVFLDHIKYGTFSNDSYVSTANQKVLAFCDKHGVDGTYAPDRVAFFESLLG